MGLFDNQSFGINDSENKKYRGSKYNTVNDKGQKCCPECGYSPIPSWCIVCKVCYSKGCL